MRALESSKKKKIEREHWRKKKERMRAFESSKKKKKNRERALEKKNPD